MFPSAPRLPPQMTQTQPLGPEAESPEQAALIMALMEKQGRMPQNQDELFRLLMEAYGGRR